MLRYSGEHRPDLPPPGVSGVGTWHAARKYGVRQRAPGSGELPRGADIGVSIGDMTDGGSEPHATS